MFNFNASSIFHTKHTRVQQFMQGRAEDEEHFINHDSSYKVANYSYLSYGGIRIWYM